VNRDGIPFKSLQNRGTPVGKDEEPSFLEYFKAYPAPKDPNQSGRPWHPRPDRNGLLGGSSGSGKWRAKAEDDHGSCYTRGHRWDIRRSAHVGAGFGSFPNILPVAVLPAPLPL
jgi:hypothetical protein